MELNFGSIRILQLLLLLFAISTDMRFIFISRMTLLVDTNKNEFLRTTNQLTPIAHATQREDNLFYGKFIKQ
jgi:hypothetical protein